MSAPTPRWTPADRELVYEAIHDRLGDATDEAAEAVLDALAAAGWRPPSRIQIHVDPRPPEVHVIEVPVDPLTGRRLRRG